jgi:hypothetical protein
MKPRKRSAGGKIVIDEQEMTWSLLREAHYSTEGYKGMTFTVRAEGERTFRELIIEFPYPERKPGFHQEKERILPQHVEAAVRLAIEMGWRPRSRGRSFILQLEPGDIAKG